MVLDRMRQLTLDIILRVVFGAGSEREIAQLREAIEQTLESVRSLPRVLAMVLVRRDLGPRSPWGRFRVAVDRFDELLLDSGGTAPSRARRGLVAVGAARAARRGR